MKSLKTLCVVAVMASTLLAAGVAVSGDRPPNPRPFKGSAKGEVTFPESEVCLGITGAPWQTVAVAEGRMTHLGLTAVYLTHCSVPDGSAAVAGEATFVAANGDEVHATYTANTVAWPEPPLMLIVQEAEFIVVGGTGRFEDASGRILGMVYVTFEGFEDPSWPLEFALAGMIIY